MTLLLALFLLGAIDQKVPTDAEIATRIEAILRAQFHPTTLTVAVHRRSRLSSVIESLDITMSGFTMNGLPMTTSAPAPAAPKPAEAKPAKPERQIRIEQLRLFCEHFTVQGLPVRQLEITGSEVCVPWSAANSGQFVVSSAASARGTAILREEALSLYLRKQHLPVSNALVTIQPDGLTVRGNLTSFVNAPVTLTGRILCQGKAVLLLDGAKLRVSSIPVPAIVVTRALQTVNPLADLNRDMPLPAPVAIEKIEHQNHQLRVEATLQFPKGAAP